MIVEDSAVDTKRQVQSPAPKASGGWRLSAARFDITFTDSSRLDGKRADGASTRKPDRRGGGIRSRRFGMQDFENGSAHTVMKRPGEFTNIHLYLG